MTGSVHNSPSLLLPASLLNARVPIALAKQMPLRNHDDASGLAFTDIHLDNAGRINTTPAKNHIDLAGRIILPTFIDSHIHLDKAFTVHRTGLPQGGLMHAVNLSMQDIPNRTEADLRTRMEKGVRLAWSNGSSALRTHLDTYVLPFVSPAWTAFNHIRYKWKDRLSLQAVALMALERVDNSDFNERCRQIAEYNGILGAFVPPSSAIASQLDKFLNYAQDHGLDVDFHVDETLDPTSNGLELIADSILRTGYAGRAMAGHCCSLSMRKESDLERLLEKLVRAELHIVALPHSNLYLQDRAPQRTPRVRGLTLVHELRAAGVPVHFASDNVQDPFFPFGNFDMLEVLRSATDLAHLDFDLSTWVTDLYKNAADATGFQDHGRITPDQLANFILFGATDWISLLSHAQSSRLVFRNGRIINPKTPELRNPFALELT